MESSLQNELKSPRHILIVDDEPIILKFLSYTLEHHGFIVTTANNGFDALKKIKENKEHFALLLSDVRMPELDGVGLLRALHDEQNRIPVLFLTAFSDLNEDVAQQIGAVGFLHKPIDPPLLIHAIENVLTG